MLVIEKFMTSKEVCRYCGFSVILLNRLEKDGILKPRRRLPTNGRWLYSKADVDDFLNKITVKRSS